MDDVGGTMNLHSFYYLHVPKWTTKYSPPLGWYNYAFYFIHPHQYIRHLLLRIKWFIQRGRRGYSDQDVSGWHRYMANINLAAMQQLSKKRIGHPIGMTMLGWHNRLLKIADGFQAFIEDEDDCISYKKLSRKEYLALVKSRQKRLAMGLKLWGEHFNNLWD